MHYDDDQGNDVGVLCWCPEFCWIHCTDGEADRELKRKGLLELRVDDGPALPSGPEEDPNV
jgi:hypothetical protein